MAALTVYPFSTEIVRDRVLEPKFKDVPKMIEWSENYSTVNSRAIKSRDSKEFKGMPDQAI